MRLINGRLDVIALGGIAVAVAVVWGGSLGHGFHYDDEHSILLNPHIQDLSNIPRFFVDSGMFSGMPEARMYRPVVLTAHAFNYWLGGWAPAGYHLMNVLLHLANAVLVWAIARGLGMGRVAAWGGALFFAVHPLASEPVSYISSRSSLLVALGALLAFYAVLRRGRWGKAWLVLGTALGLGAKATAVFVPVFLWGYLYSLQRARRDCIWWGLPAALVVCYVLGVRALAAKALLQPVRGLAEQGATQIKAWGYYIWTAAMPVHLSVEPQFSVGRWDSAAVWLSAAFLGTLLVVLWRLRRAGPVVALGAAWAGLALVPVSAVPLFVLVNEHRLYVPLAGMAWGLAWLLQNGGRRVWLGAVLGCLGLLALERGPVWESDERLWADAVAKGPLMARPHVNLGKAYLEQGRLDEAIASSRRGLQLDPGLALAHYNIATAYLAQGRYEAAAASYRRALEIQPGLLQAYNNLGNAYRQLGDTRRAAESYRQALQQQPAAALWHNLGTVYLEGGQADSSIAAYRRALAMDGATAETYRGLGRALRQAGRMQEALDTVRQGIQKWPEAVDLWKLAGDLYAGEGAEEAALAAYVRGGLQRAEACAVLARAALRAERPAAAVEWAAKARAAGLEAGAGYRLDAEILRQRGDTVGALQAWRQAARLKPGDAAIYGRMAQVLLQEEKYPEAAAAIGRARQLEPQNAAWAAMAGQVHERAGQWPEAEKAYAAAVRLAPAQGAYRLNWGVVLHRLGHLQEARNALRQAVERLPQSAAAHAALGALYVAEGAWAAAAARLAQAVQMDATDAVAWLNLAEARSGLGDRAGAAAAYERFLERNGRDNEMGRRAAARLEGLRAGSGG